MADAIQAQNPHARKPLTQERLAGLLHYDPESGSLTWKARPVAMFRDGKQSSGHNCSIWNGRYSGKEAGYKGVNGVQVRIGRVGYMAHQLIWLLVTGVAARVVVDHKDLDPLNNRWCNLREADKAQNGQNRPAPVNNTSGYKGVYWQESRKKWAAEIYSHNKKYRLGRFNTIEAARDAYARAAAELHKDFARTS